MTGAILDPTHTTPCTQRPQRTNNRDGGLMNPPPPATPGQLQICPCSTSTLPSPGLPFSLFLVVMSQDEDKALGMEHREPNKDLGGERK